MTLSVDTEGTILDINHVAWSLGLSEISTSLALGGPDPFSSKSKSGFRLFLEFVILAEHLDFYHLEKKTPSMKRLVREFHIYFASYPLKGKIRRVSL